MSRPLRILTWHVHGNYLYSLTHLPHRFIVPVLPGNPPGYSALGPNIPWPDNVRMVPAKAVRDEAIDCVIYQSRGVFEHDRHTLLSSAQQGLPCVYIEHNPPEPHPTDTRHVFRHDRGVLVHVTHYNALMWDAAGMPVRVIEHGVPEVPGVYYSGELPCGIVVVNNLASRGRRVGADVYDWFRTRLPLELIGMGSQAVAGGRGEVANLDVPARVARHRFFFSPIRYASLGLSLVEAMLAGVPVVGIAATELNQVIRNGVNGYVDTRREVLVEVGRTLLEDADLAHRWGGAARETARARFGIERFIADWNGLLSELSEASHVSG
ncbi:glycosyltransferase family 4 protein [bacterium SGD-2]|nr:glycosyltransferase family 4 protein [bacterium SGD-2]